MDNTNKQTETTVNAGTATQVNRELTKDNLL